jgi:hypothetical protein
MEPEPEERAPRYHPPKALQAGKRSLKAIVDDDFWVFLRFWVSWRPFFKIWVHTEKKGAKCQKTR